MIQKYHPGYSHSKEIKSTCQQNICIISVFISVQIKKKRKQFRCLSTDKWIKKMYIHIYNRILVHHEKNEILLFVTIWMKLEIIMLNKTSQA